MDKIIGIGNALVDVLALLKDETLLESLNLPKGGMQLIDASRQQEITASMQSWEHIRATGGSAGNTILALANLNAAPAFAGRVGNDENGTFFWKNCKQTGIDARLVVANGVTGVANTFITPDGERTFATHLGVAATLDAKDITPQLFEGYSLVHIEGYLVQNHDLIEKICRVAKEQKLRTSIDLASYNIVKEDLTFFRHLVREYIDIVFANEEESAAFTKGKGPEEALEEIAGMCDVAVVKLGAKGSSAMANGQKSFTAACSTEVLDTTAAGDFFAGGFLYALTHGGTLEQCLQAGGLLSANIIRVVGTRLSEENWNEIRLKLAEILS